MIFRSIAKDRFKEAQIRCNKSGAFVCLKWTEWSSSGAGPEPDYDPTTGALLTAGTSDTPIIGSFRTRAFVHYVGPTESRARMFAEIKQGDIILDLVIPLLQIANPGSTSFFVGQIVDLFCFGAANRALAPGGILPPGATLATAMPGYIQVESLQNPEVTTYKSKCDWEKDENGQLWVQQEIGKDLAESWSVVYDGILLGQTMLLRRAT